MKAIPLLALLALMGCKDDIPDTGDSVVSVPDDDGDGFDAEVDCDDSDAAINPSAVELCDGLDNDCDGTVDQNASDAPTWYGDSDGDGYGDEDATVTDCVQPVGSAELAGDCDDEDPAYNPGATEDDCSDPNDYNCDGSVGYADADGDGWAACEECDDSVAAINPDASEVCDDIDNDCDGLIDDGDDSLDASTGSTWYADGDGDGYGDPASASLACDQPSGAVSDSSDCDDGEAAVNPAASEICNTIDDDCDGDIDDDDDSLDTSTASTWYGDGDGDGYGDASASSIACDQPSGAVSDSSDCDDGEAAVNPAASEICNTIDDDCDGDIDDDDGSLDTSSASTWYDDGDGDGYGDASASSLACDQPSGAVSDSTDCDDGEAAVNPGESEICNSIDDDCDGDIDDDDDSLDTSSASAWYDDSDGDGEGDPDSETLSCDQPSGTTSDDSDCDDGDANINTGASEVCDSIDNDCDGDVDDDDGDVDTSTGDTYYADSDGDGYGDPDSTTEACDTPSGYTDDDTDCDDSDAAIKPDSSGACALGETCDDILAADSSATDGTYTIDPDGYGAGLDPIDVSCDMSTDGGGWTLVFHVFDVGGFQEDDFIAEYGHNLWTDETWSYDGAAMADGLNGDSLETLSTQGMISAATMDGLWDDIRMSCSQSDSDSTESEYVQVDGFATTNGNWDLLAAAANGTSYTVDSTLNSMALSTVWHDNETTTQNSGHYLCDYTNSKYSSSYGGAPQFSFCYTDHLNNPNSSDFGDSIVAIAFGTYEGGDGWSDGFTFECGDMSTTALQNAGTFSIWLR